MYSNNLLFCKCFSTMFNFLLPGTYNRNTHLFDVNTFQPVKDLTGHLGTITGMTLNPSGNFLFTCSSDNTVQVAKTFIKYFDNIQNRMYLLPLTTLQFIAIKSKNSYLLPPIYACYERGSIVVRAHASHAEGLRFEPDSMP